MAIKPKKMNTEEKKSFNIQFWRFLWASILIGLSACLGNVVDAMIVGNLIDEDSVSAINLSLPLLHYVHRQHAAGYLSRHAGGNGIRAKGYTTIIVHLRHFDVSLFTGWSRTDSMRCTGTRCRNTPVV